MVETALFADKFIVVPTLPAGEAPCSTLMRVSRVVHPVRMRRVAHTMRVAGVAQDVGMRVRWNFADAEHDVLRPAGCAQRRAR